MGDEVERALEGVEALYTANLREHGVDSRSVGWPREEAQLLRFEKLAMVLEGAEPGHPVSVNDLGCGYAAMFRWLDERGAPPIGRYVGYDISEEMLDAAREHAADPRVELVHGAELTEEADYSFVSGTFNVKMGASDADWGEYVRGVVRELAARSRRGFAFNLLTSYVDWKKDDLFYADPTEWFDFCKREISPRVALLHDYPLWEWTIVVRTGDA